MGIMRWAFYERFKELHPNVSMTYGYITKNTRIKNGLEKSHEADARCISGNPLVRPGKEWYDQKKVRCNNRRIHKANFLKGGKKKNNQAPYEVKGFRLFDKVRFKGEEYFVLGRRQTGYFDLKGLDGNKVNKSSISHKRIEFVECNKSLLIEKEGQFLP